MEAEGSPSSVAEARRRRPAPKGRVTEAGRPKEGTGAWLTCCTVKLVALRADPLAFSTLIFAVMAPAGTTALTELSLLTEKDAESVPNLTVLRPANPVPFKVTVVPTAPDSGENEERVGAGGGGAVSEKFGERSFTLALVDREAEPYVLASAKTPKGLPVKVRPVKVRFAKTGIGVTAR